MRSTPRSLLFPLLAVLAAGGCRDDGAPARATAAPLSTDQDTLYGASGAENLRVVPVEVEVPRLPAGLDGLRIAALSDFQLGQWDDNARVAAAAVRRAVDLRPDVIVLLGDYTTHGNGLDALNRVLAPLRGHLVMAVLGDHDELDPGEHQGEVDSAAIRTVETLKQNGIIVLQNERGRVSRGRDTIFIAGIDPYVARRPDWRQEEIFKGIPRTGITALLLSHMPQGALAAPDSAYPLVLAGHAFCGRIEVPGTPRLSWYNTEIFPSSRVGGADRLYRVRGNGVFISCGIGHTYVPVRLGAPPEVVLVTLRSVAAPASADSAQVPNLDSLVQKYERRDTTRPADTTSRDTTKKPIE